jgi:hypothetical protein
MSEMMGSLQELALGTIQRGTGPVRTGRWARWAGLRGRAATPGCGTAFINKASSHGLLVGMVKIERGNQGTARLCWDSD